MDSKEKIIAALGVILVGVLGTIAANNSFEEHKWALAIIITVIVVVILVLIVMVVLHALNIKPTKKPTDANQDNATVSLEEQLLAEGIEYIITDRKQVFEYGIDKQNGPFITIWI